MLRHHTIETTEGHPVYLIPGDVYIAKRLILSFKEVDSMR
jgi:hypothetical protein